jgi:carbon storage regulator CsrA
MLVLTRNIGEKIIIGKRLVTLTVLELNDKSVSIGIDAEKTISIHREEIYDRIERGEKMEGNK